MPSSQRLSGIWRRDLLPNMVAHATIDALGLLAKRGSGTVSMAPGMFVVDGALDVMQIDHTQVDLHVVDEEFRRPIGRPWITVAMDIGSVVLVARMRMQSLLKLTKSAHCAKWSITC
jgi:hypothetical protein